MKYRMLALIVAAAGVAHAADEFDRIVGAIENHYGVKRTHVPLMGVANFVVKVAHPAGARGFKLAIFEDLGSAAEYGDARELDEFMDRLGSNSLHPLVVTHSRPQNESTYILAGEIGKSTRMLIATFDRNEATVVEVQVDVDTLVKVIGSPAEARKYSQGDRQRRDDRDW